MSGPPSSDTLKRWHDRIESMLSSVVRVADSMCDCQSKAAEVKSAAPATSMRATATRVLAEVCHHYDVHPDDVAGEDRCKTIAFARFHWYFALRERGLSYPEIGRLVQRDHSTVMAGVRKFERVAGLVT